MKKVLQLIALLGLLATNARAQLVLSAYHDVAWRQVAGLPGFPASGATITVCTFPGNQATFGACSNIATIYGGPGGNVMSNPFTADASGNYAFWAPAGNYTVTVTGANLQGYAQNISISAGSALFSSLISATNTQANMVVGNGASLSTSGNGQITATQVPSGTTNPTTCTPSLGQLFVNTSSNPVLESCGPAINTWSTVAGNGKGNPVGALNSLQKNAGGGNFAATPLVENGTNITSNEDFHFKGTNPWIDVTTYGARPVNPSTTPAAVGLTATCTSGQPAVTISSASSFQNGDGVVVYGCGVPQSMSTPSAPTVTPSLPNSATGVGGLGFTVAGPTGSTTYNYKIFARDKNGGLTAVSPAGTTTTGAASLGTQTVNITSLSRASNGTVTVVTASAHGLITGAMVHISTTSVPGDFDGWVVVSGSADNTHFTYVNGITTVESATGGTVTYWNCNHLSWSAVTGAWEYYIASDRANPGTYATIGVSKPSGSYTDLTWDDYGSPMMDGIALPPYIPSLPPTVATSDNLSTTISSGAGSTSLTLAANASTTCPSASCPATVSIRYDACPNIITAAAAANGSAPLYFPVSTVASGTYVINSYCDLSADGALAIAQVGGLTLNETFVVTSGIKWYGDRIPFGQNPPQFGFQGSPTVATVTGNPGIYVKNGNSTLFQALQITGSANAAQLMVIDGGTQITLSDVGFAAGGGNADYMTVGLNIRSGGVGSNAFATFFDRLLFLAGSQTSVTATPMWICDRCGITSIGRVQASGRGIFFAVQESGGQPVTMDYGYIQAGVAPFFMAANRSSLAGSYIFRRTVLDTMGNPLFSWTGPQTQAPAITLTQFGTPSSGEPTVSGGILSSIVSDSPVSGQNVNATVVSGGAVTVSSVAGGLPPSGLKAGVQVSGPLSMGYALATPAAPTVVVGAHASCGANCVAAGTYYYFVSAIDANGGYSAESVASSAAVTDGTQTITVSWVPVNGQALTNIGRNTTPTVGSFGFQPGTFTGVTGTSFTDLSTQGYNGAYSPRTTIGNAEGLSAQGFAGHQIILVDPASTFVATAKPTTLSANRVVTTPDGPSTTLLVASLTTTAAASDNVTVQGMTASGHCILTPTNASAATNIATTFVSAKTTNQITVSHTATSGMTYDIGCTLN